MDMYKELEYVHKVLGTKYHFFAVTDDRGVLLRLETNDCCKYSFKGMTMRTAVKEALDYVKQEIKAGSLKDIKTEEEHENQIHRNRQLNSKK